MSIVTTIGNAIDARKAALQWQYGYDWQYWDQDQPYEPIVEIGQGEDRTAYLIHGTVYKVGTRDSANRYDHATLTAARNAGHPWAPETSLYEVAIPDPATYQLYPVPVLAMPLLQDDGTYPDPEALAAMHAQTGGQVDHTNYVVIAGRPVVIDGCTVVSQPVR